MKTGQPGGGRRSGAGARYPQAADRQDD
jgi:hypothetical protein